jgi:hypothetical protein
MTGLVCEGHVINGWDWESKKKKIGKIVNSTMENQVLERMSMLQTVLGMLKP